MPLYGQVVVGPPGSGKTTYCDGMQQYLRLLGRDAWVINLDPANESAPPSSASASAAAADGADGLVGEAEASGGRRERERSGTGERGDGDGDAVKGDGDGGHQLPYDTLVDVCDELVNLSSVMDEFGLGPNGGLLYCMEYIEKHLDHLVSLIKERTSDSTRRPYLLLDLPGQVELYTHQTCVHNIMTKLSKALDLRLTMVQLIDAHFCADAAKFISAAVLSTTTMLRLELPAVNVLSKVDLIGKYGGEGGLPFNLDYFTECRDLERLADFIDADPSATADDDNEWEYADDPEYAAATERRRKSAFYKRRKKLNEVMCEVVDDFSLLSFVPLDISDAGSVGRVVARVDRANGYVFLGGGDGGDADAPPSKEREERGGDEVRDMFQCAMQTEGGEEWGYEQTADVQERFLGMFNESIPELKGEGGKSEEKKDIASSR